jgi:tetratricopeptide (TPR) repeat protein
MTSLYDLIGARADDDAEALKRAFREAVKAHHPDLHAGDPDAPLRFMQIVAANAVLRDAKQRASYDWLLQLEPQRFRQKLERQQIQLKLERQQLRLKRMRAAFAVGAVGALVGGYGLFALMPTTSVVEIKKDEPAVTSGATVEKDRQAAIIIAAAEKNENSTAVAAAKADAVKDDMDDAGGPVDTASALLMVPAIQPDQGEPSRKLASANVRDGVIKPSTDASATKSGNTQVVGGRELAAATPLNDANFYRERGIAAYRSGDFLGAIGNFDEAIRLNPNDAQSYDFRGNVWDELGIFERALTDYDEAVRIDPNNPSIFHDRAILWQRKGALDKALVDLDRAIRFSFADANIYCDRGLVWYQKGRHNRAVADFDRAIKLDANFAAACINRGLILHRDSEFKVALATVNQAIRVDPGIFDVRRRINLNVSVASRNHESSAHLHGLHRDGVDR